MSNSNSNFNTAAVFLDISKASDMVWHDGLFYKMQILEIPSEIIKIIEFFMSDRTLSSKIDNKLYTLRPVLSGVSQGSCCLSIL